MSVIIEQKLKACQMCGKFTKHHRNNSKSSGFMIFMHIFLSIVTAGVWLVLIAFWKFCMFKIGGWKCSQCSA